VRKLLPAVCAIIVLPLLAGCFMLPAETPLMPPPTIARPAEWPFVTVPVLRGDIKLEASPVVMYLPSRVIGHQFTENGIPLLGIFVAFGDEVSEGDIIAVLDMPEIQYELEEVSRRRARINLELTLLRERQSLAARHAAEVGVAADTAAYVSARNRLMADMDVVDMLYAYVSELNEARYLRAAISGVVTRVLPFTEGMLSDVNHVIAVVADQGFTSFVVRDSIAARLKPGEQYEMVLGGETFMMEVIDPEEHGFVREDQTEGEVTPAFLQFIYAPAEVPAATHGRLRIPLEEVIDVLHIPVSLLRRTEYRSFVYVLSESGYRMVRDVETGLESEGYIEVVRGLSEGELLIL